MNWILEFQRGLRIAPQRCEVHKKGIFDGEDGVVFKIRTFPIEDLSSYWLVAVSLHLYGVSLRHKHIQLSLQSSECEQADMDACPAVGEAFQQDLESGQYRFSFHNTQNHVLTIERNRVRSRPQAVKTIVSIIIGLEFPT
jgi:hypothetical protein